MNEQDNLTRAVRGIPIDIGNNLVNKGSYDALFESSVRPRSVPDGSEVFRQCGKGSRWVFWPLRAGAPVGGKFFLDLGLPSKGRFPPRLQFRGNQTVSRVAGVVLLEGTLRSVPGGFQIALQRFPDCIAPGDRLGLGMLCGAPHNEPEQEPVVDLSRRVDGLLVHQNRIDHPAHLDQLLPVPAVQGSPILPVPTPMK